MNNKFVTALRSRITISKAIQCGLVALMIFSSTASFADGGTDHCKVAQEKAKEAANEFGNGNFGNAGEAAGQAAGAFKMCLNP